MFFIGQNLKDVHMTYSFPKLLIFFWLTLFSVRVYFSPYQKNIVFKWNEYKFHGKAIMK